MSTTRSSSRLVVQSKSLSKPEFVAGKKSQVKRQIATEAQLPVATKQMIISQTAAVPNQSNNKKKQRKQQTVSEYQLEGKNISDASKNFSDVSKPIRESSSIIKELADDLIDSIQGRKWCDNKNPWFDPIDNQNECNVEMAMEEKEFQDTFGPIGDAEQINASLTNTITQKSLSQVDCCSLFGDLLLGISVPTFKKGTTTVVGKAEVKVNQATLSYSSLSNICKAVFDVSSIDDE